MRILEPVAWWQAYAEWYARPISLEEMVKRLMVLSRKLAAAYTAFGLTVQQAALPSQKGTL